MSQDVFSQGDLFRLAHSFAEDFGASISVLVAVLMFGAWYLGVNIEMQTSGAHGTDGWF